jgi:hypothetical protein
VNFVPLARYRRQYTGYRYDRLVTYEDLGARRVERHSSLVPVRKGTFTLLLVRTLRRTPVAPAAAGKSFYKRGYFLQQVS